MGTPSARRRGERFSRADGKPASGDELPSARCRCRSTSLDVPSSAPVLMCSCQLGNEQSELNRRPEDCLGRVSHRPAVARAARSPDALPPATATARSPPGSAPDTPTCEAPGTLPRVWAPRGRCSTPYRLSPRTTGATPAPCVRAPSDRARRGRAPRSRSGGARRPAHTAGIRAGTAARVRSTFTHGCGVPDGGCRCSSGLGNGMTRCVASSGAGDALVLVSSVPPMLLSVRVRLMCG